MPSNNIIPTTKYWLDKTIIEFNFCPFAKKEFVNYSIHYEVVDDSNTEEQLLAFAHELKRLDDHPEIETTLFILSKGLESFFDYLDFLQLATDLSVELGYEGKYQLASFHPDYCFEGSNQADTENYTNRSPFPMIHIIREASLERVLKHYPEPENIPIKNMALARESGAEVFQKTLKKSTL